MNHILKQVHPYSVFYSNSDNRWNTIIYQKQTLYKPKRPLRISFIWFRNGSYDLLKIPKKAFASLRGILKSVFDMAYSEYLVSDNVYQRVDFSLFKNMYIPETPIDNRMHPTDEVYAIIQELHRREKTRPMYSSIWALEMQILMGARCGELPRLPWMIFLTPVFASQKFSGTAKIHA